MDFVNDPKNPRLTGADPARIDPREIEIRQVLTGCDDDELALIEADIALYEHTGLMTKRLYDIVKSGVAAA